jgi:hypothetical protein
LINQGSQFRWDQVGGRMAGGQLEVTSHGISSAARRHADGGSTQ